MASDQWCQQHWLDVRPFTTHQCIRLGRHSPPCLCHCGATLEYVDVAFEVLNVEPVAPVRSPSGQEP